MASTSTKAPCATCGNKAAGIFRCEGCVQVFCRKHLNEHRDVLSHQLDEIVLEHDTLQQTIVENSKKSNNQHPVLKEIDRWEQESIAKVQRLAEEARNEVRNLMNRQTVSKELHGLAERLQKARIDDDYVETDLRTWTSELQILRDGINTSSPSLTVQEDRRQVVVGHINIAKAAVQLRNQSEKFGKFFGNIRIEENGRLATNIGPRNNTAFVRGVGEYSRGKHKIRFLFKKKSLSFVTWFEIVSKLPMDDGVENTGYGWLSNDGICRPRDLHMAGVSFQDMKGQTTFEIELELDCDNRKIRYINQNTQNRREMDVDITKCPFPWQVRFYMFEMEDSVRLLT